MFKPCFKLFGLIFCCLLLTKCGVKTALKTQNTEKGPFHIYNKPGQLDAEGNPELSENEDKESNN